MTIIDSFYIVPKDLTNTPTGLATEWGSPPETVITVSWNAVTDINGAYPAGYKIIRDGSIVGTVGHDTLTFSDTGLSEAISYDYQIASTDRWDNISTYSSVVTKATKDSTAPSIPLYVTANPDATTPTTKIYVAWQESIDNSGTVSSYQVYRDAALSGSPPAYGSPVYGSPPYDLIATITGSPLATNYTNTGLLPSTEHNYRITATDPTGNESEMSIVATALTAYDAQAVDLQATGTDYYTNTTMSISDSKVGTMSFWYYATSLGQEVIYAGDKGTTGALDYSMAVYYSAGDIYLRGYAATSLDAHFTVASGAANYDNWKHIAISWDNAAGTIEAYVNGAETSVTISTQANANVAHSTATAHFIGNSNASSLSAWTEHLAEFYFDPTTAVDLASNIDIFYDAPTRSSMYLGDTGERPTGSQPKVYLAGGVGSPADFNVNLGSGGSFTTVGTIIDSDQEPVVATVDIEFTEMHNDIPATTIGGSGWQTVGLVDVPANATVQIICYNTAINTSYNMGVRETGSAKVRYLKLLSAVGGGANYYTTYVRADSASQVEFYCESPNAAQGFIMTGYCSTGWGYGDAQFDSISASSGAWGSRTLSATAKSNVTIALPSHPTSTTNTAIRDTDIGGTYDFLPLQDGSDDGAGLGQNWWTKTVQLNASSQFDVYGNGGYYLGSHGGATWVTASATIYNAEHTATSASTWETWTLDASIPIGSIVEVTVVNKETTTENQAGVRGGDSTDTTRIFDIAQADGSATTVRTVTLLATVGAGRDIDIYAEHTANVEFRVNGWWA